MLRETLRSSPGSPSEEMLQNVLSGAEMIDRILLAMGRYSIAREVSRYRFVKVDTGIALRTAVVNLQRELTETGTIVTHETLPEVEADVERLAEVFQILIENAMTYRREETPRVDIQAKRDSDSWVLSVEDNGIGIQPQYRTKVFTPFFRLHGPEIPGVGLGLAIGKEVVEAHGGRIWIEETTGPGSKFSFTLPALDGEYTTVTERANSRSLTGLP
jgi:chemotaxis family two-component system sensor kinase Cph1